LIGGAYERERFFGYPFGLYLLKENNNKKEFIE